MYVGNIVFPFLRTKYSKINQKITFSRILLTDAVHGDTAAVHVSPPPVLRIVSSHRHGHAVQARGRGYKQKHFTSDKVKTKTKTFLFTLPPSPLSPLSPSLFHWCKSTKHSSMFNVEYIMNIECRYPLGVQLENAREAASGLVLVSTLCHS